MGNNYYQEPAPPAPPAEPPRKKGVSPAVVVLIVLLILAILAGVAWLLFGDSIEWPWAEESEDSLPTRETVDVGKGGKRMSAPELTEATNVVDGVRVSWKAVEGAENYRVLRKTLSDGSEGDWEPVGDTEELSLVDGSARSASRYAYTVVVLSADGRRELSDFDTTGRVCTYIAAPKITGSESRVDGLLLQWSKPAGAKNFRVFKQNQQGEWEPAADVTDTSWLDASAEIGVKYLYTVRVLNQAGDMYISSYNSYGWSAIRNPLPKLTEAVNTVSGVRLNWEAVEGAKSYRVLRRLESEKEWTLLGETTEATYLDESAVSAERYCYTVEFVDGKNMLRRDLRDEVGRVCTFIAAPKITSIRSEAKGVALEWSVPAGAKNFRVFRKTEDGEWTAIGEGTFSSYLDTTAEKGVKYWYTVRALNLAGDMYISSYNSYGWSVTKE